MYDIDFVRMQRRWNLESEYITPRIPEKVEGENLSPGSRQRGRHQSSSSGRDVNQDDWFQQPRSAQWETQAKEVHHMLQ